MKNNFVIALSICFLLLTTACGVNYKHSVSYGGKFENQSDNHSLETGDQKTEIDNTQLNPDQIELKDVLAQNTTQTLSPKSIKIARKMVHLREKNHATPQIDSTTSAPKQLKTEPFASAAFTLAIVGFPALILGGLGILCFILGIIFGIIAINNIKKHPDELTGKGKATAAIVISAIALVLIAAAITAFFIALAGAW